MAQVYLARDEDKAKHAAPEYETLVVLKRVLPHLALNPRFESMFANEARLASMIRHPNVVEVQGLLRDGEELFLVMEFLDGKNLLALGKTCDSGGFWLPYPLLARILADAAAGVHQAHILTDEFGRSIHFVHRDLTPENIVVCFDGRVKVVDFGIAKARMSPETTQVGIIKGKLNYLAPEALQGLKLDARADIYTLGVSLYLFLTARFPYTGRDTEAMLKSLLNDPIIPPQRVNSQVPASLQEICLRCLARDREQRYPSAAALQADLVQFIQRRGSRVHSAHIASFMEEMYPRETDPLRAWVAGISGQHVVGSGADGRVGPHLLPPPALAQGVEAVPQMRHGGTEEMQQDISIDVVMPSGFTNPGQWAQAGDIHGRATFIVSALEASGLHVVPRQEVLGLDPDEATHSLVDSTRPQPGLSTQTTDRELQQAFVPGPVRSTRRAPHRPVLLWALAVIGILLGGSLLWLGLQLAAAPNHSQVLDIEDRGSPSSEDQDREALPLEPIPNLAPKINNDAKEPAAKVKKKRRRPRRRKRRKARKRSRPKSRKTSRKTTRKAAPTKKSP